MHDYSMFDLVDEEGACLQCGRMFGVDQPRGCCAYCEDCGFPEEDFDDYEGEV